MPSIDAMLITLAGRSRAAAFSAPCSAWVRKNGVFMFRSTTLSQPISGKVSKSSPQAAPALFTRMCSAGSCRVSSAASRRAPSTLETSIGSEMQGPMRDSSSAAASQAAALRALM